MLFPNFLYTIFYKNIEIKIKLKKQIKTIFNSKQIILYNVYVDCLMSVGNKCFKIYSYILASVIFIVGINYHFILMFINIKNPFQFIFI